MNVAAELYVLERRSYNRFPGSVVIHLQVARMQCESEVSLRPALEGEDFNMLVGASEATLNFRNNNIQSKA